MLIWRISYLLHRIFQRHLQQWRQVRHASLLRSAEDWQFGEETVETATLGADSQKLSVVRPRHPVEWTLVVQIDDVVYFLQLIQIVNLDARRTQTQARCNDSRMWQFFLPVVSGRCGFVERERDSDTRQVVLVVASLKQFLKLKNGPRVSF